MSAHVCEADLLAREGFQDDECPPCSAPGTVSVMDRWLCAGCADALSRIRAFCRSVAPRTERGP